MFRGRALIFRLWIGTRKWNNTTSGRGNVPGQLISLRHVHKADEETDESRPTPDGEAEREREKKRDRTKSTDTQVDETQHFRIRRGKRRCGNKNLPKEQQQKTCLALLLLLLFFLCLSPLFPPPSFKLWSIARRPTDRREDRGSVTHKHTGKAFVRSTYEKERKRRRGWKRRWERKPVWKKTHNTTHTKSLLILVECLCMCLVPFLSILYRHGSLCFHRTHSKHLVWKDGCCVLCVNNGAQPCVNSLL